jgi:hypothetical protein
MDRREALELTAWILGIPIIGSQTFLSSCANPKIQNEPFDETYIELLNVLADAILPETQKSLGAKQANVGAFILFIVRDWAVRTARYVYQSLMAILGENLYCFK